MTSESRESRELFELVRAIAYMVAAKVTLNPHTQDPRVRHPKSLHEPVGHPPHIIMPSPWMFTETKTK
jgi:hypothetical protein